MGSLSTDKELAAMFSRARRLLKELRELSDFADTKRRNAVLQELFGAIGKRVHVDIDFHCEYGKNIFIGDKVIINMNCTFIDNNRIDIGDNVLIAPGVQIYTATHSAKAAERRVPGDDENKSVCVTIAHPVKIEDNAWIGGGTIILPGVTVGKNSVVGAGSVVTHDIPANVVAVGNPCRVIKHIEND